MSELKSQLELLKSAARGLVTVSLPVDANSAADVGESAVNPLAGIGYGTLNVTEGTVTRFSQEALPDVEALTKSLRDNRAEYVRGVGFRVMRECVAKTVIGMFRGRSGAEVAEMDLTELKRQVDEWFAGTAVMRQHLVPCNVLPSSAQAFDFGPIRFFHISDLNPDDYGLPAGDGVIDTALEPLTRIMGDHAAGWLGEVSVEGCEKKRSAEIAELAVDVALGGLQLVIPAALGRRMARVTARRLPSYRGSFAVTDGSVEFGVENEQAGLGLAPDDFEKLIDLQSDAIAAMGRLIDVYVSGQGDLPMLKRAWCDAVYWFHEGMSEPLDTVAVVQLETSMEILFSAASRTGSEKRILDGLQGMFGIDGSQRIDASSAMTYGELVRKIVKARSWVVHGNWPTLALQDQGIDRATVESIARQFLIEYPLLLEKYAREVDVPALDEARAFLDWAVSTGSADGGRDGGEGYGCAPEANSRQAVLSTLTSALRVADGIDDHARRVEALAGISGLLHRAGDVSIASKTMSAALTLAGRITDGSAQASALGAIAQTQAGTGDPEAAGAAIAGALAAVPATGGGEARASALEAIAKAQAAVGDCASALATAQGVETCFERHRLLGEISFLALSAGKFEEALTAARAIMDCGRQVHCLVSVAKARGETGDVPGAQRAIAEILEAAPEVTEEFDRVLALVQTCEVQVAIEDFPAAARSMAAAISVAGAIGDDGDSVLALVHVARNQPRCGDRSGAAHTIARALAVAGRMSEAPSGSAYSPTLRSSAS